MSDTHLPAQIVGIFSFMNTLSTVDALSTMHLRFRWIFCGWGIPALLHGFNFVLSKVSRFSRNWIWLQIKKKSL